MEFKTFTTTSMTVKQRGFWKPLFKFRYTDNYFDKTKRTEFENRLRENLFGNSTNSMVITRNMYPFPFDNNIEQYVVWIRDGDPGIDKIKSIIEKIYPDFDYIISINKPNYRSIKSILHYHLLLSPPQPFIKLNKLVVFNRHGNRYPITKFPAIEKKLGNNDFSEDPNALLLDIGCQNSLEFGICLKNIYNLSIQFMENSIFLTSPVQRCRQTIENIIAGLDIGEKTPIDYIPLKPSVPREISNFLDCNNQNSSCHDLLEYFNDIFSISNDDNPCPRLLNLYDIYCSIKCYQDMGIDMDKYIDTKKKQELKIKTREIYNIYSDYVQICLKDFIKDLLEMTTNLSNNLIICSSHDTLVFIMAKYLARQNGITDDLELPEYLANIRIEEWSDNTTRIFYNNYYLGNKI